MKPEKVVMLAAAVLLLSAAGFAERILYVGLEVSRNDSVSPLYMKLGEGNPTNYVIPGNYRISIMDTSGRTVFESPIQLSFMVLVDPPVETQTAVIGLRIKYERSMDNLSLYKKESEDKREELIYSTRITLCDHDDECDFEYESYLSCPGDCPLNRMDGICLKDAEGICDPDCVLGADPDCTLNAPSGTCNFNLICEPNLGESSPVCADCVPAEDGVCKMEGELLYRGGNVYCCEGLVPVSLVNPLPEGGCPSNGSLAVCTYCGDGSCDEVENYCNCPLDCEPYTLDHPAGPPEEIICGNGACDIYDENSLTCPEDCPSGSSDGYCDGLGDGKCDPDCEGNDQDCGLNYLMGYVKYIIVLSVLSFIVLLIRQKLRKAE